MNWIHSMITNMLERAGAVSRIPKQASAVHASTNEESIIMSDIGRPDSGLMSSINTDTLVIWSAKIVGDEEVVVGTR